MNIALVGNQNCGKTTLFNALTGSNQKVGNWAGVTVEKKTGIIKGTSHTLIDLPGIYSLTPYTAEESISRNYIFNEKPDLILNLIDATCLERSLCLTTQLIQQNCNVIVVLNMCENLQKIGQTVDEKILSKDLNLPCIKINALSGKNLNELILLVNSYKKSQTEVNIFNNEIDALINKITESFTPKISKFCAIELLENYSKKTIIENNFQTDNNISSNRYNIKTMEKKFDFKRINLFNVFKNLHKKKDYKKNIEKNEELYTLPLFNYSAIEKDVIRLQNKYNLGMCHLIANLRYEFIEKILDKCVHKNNNINTKQSITEKLDKVFLNKFFAIPIFIGIMGLVYFLSVGIVGKYSSSIIDNGISAFSNLMETWLKGLNSSEILISMICNGIIAGVGAVLNFVPQLIILFLCITLLETTGYMSRISFMLDNFFYKIGLSGKSLIPFIVGSGCSVPAIMSTRTIENSNEKQTTVILTPFVPCSAKLPIISLFTAYFFTRSWLVTTFIYLFSIFLIITCAYVFRKFIFKSANNTLIFELPEYKKPSFKYVFKDVSQKTTSFIKRAGSTILICSIIVWFLVSFNWKFQYGVNIKDSILASIGNLFAWAFYPFLKTYSWGATVSALQGLIAKEQVVSSMTIIAGVSAENISGNLIFSQNGIFSFFTPVTALAFLVFNLFSAPCFSAIIAMKKELGSVKKTIFTVLFQIIIALILANLVTLFGTLITIAI